MKEVNRKKVGWEVFNSESLYNGHEKRIETMHNKFKPKIVQNIDYTSVSQKNNTRGMQFQRRILIKW